MRKLLKTLFILMMACSVQAQSDLIITAAYDGPLTGGVPKGLELYATGDIADLSIYGLGVANNGGGSDGLEYNFPADNISAGTYIYWTLDEVGFNLFFGFLPEYISDDANVNGDDAFELYKDGVVVDVLGDVALDGSGEPWEYLDGWAYRVPGTGPDATFQLANWTFSGINALDGFSTNAAATNPVPLKSYDMMVVPDYEINTVGNTFVPADLTVEVGETVLWKNTGEGFHNVNGSQGTFASNPAGFFSGAPSTDLWEFTHTFTIPGVYDYQCDPHAGINMVGTITVNEPAGPNYITNDIATVTTVDGNGLPDSISAFVDITGIVHGIDFATSGNSSFFLLDASGGVGISATGYTVVEGDELNIKGMLSQNNGLTIVNADSLNILSQGNTLFDPAVVSMLDESTEGEIIRINNLNLVDASQWEADGSSFTAMATDGTNMFAIRVDGDSEVADRPAPLSTFDLIGFGSQFDTSSPYDEGYQINPRFNTDVMEQGGAAPQAAIDQFDLDINESITQNVLENDFIPADIISFEITTNPSNGVAAVSGDSSIMYSPSQDFCGADSLAYAICVTGDLCDTAWVQINVNCPTSYPAYDINDLTTVNASGVPDSFEVTCSVTGIVYGVNLRPAGLQFTLIDKSDADAGIGIFLNTGDLGYSVTEGDEIVVEGIVDFFNGTTQIIPDGIEVISQGNALHDAQQVDSFDEATESKLIELKNVSMITPSQWGNGTASGFNIDVTDGTNQFAVRIDADVDLFTMSAPTGNFNVVGIGGQFDNSDPHDSGYQLLPRYAADISPANSTIDTRIDSELLLYPNPVMDQLMIEGELEWESIRVYNTNGTLILQKEFNGKNTVLDVHQFTSGQYILKLIHAEGVQGLSFQKI